MNVLVLGRGSVGQRHHRNLHALGANSTLLSYSGFVKLQDESVRKCLGQHDGAVVATSTPIRLEVIRSLAQAGLPLYIEKPLAFRKDDVRNIHQLSKDIAARSMVGFMMRYHPAFRYLAEQDLSGIYRFAFRVGHDVRQWRPGRKFKGSYGALADGGGVLLDLCHELDMAGTLFPQASLDGVSCLGHSDYPAVDFLSRIDLRTPTSLGTVAMDYLSPVAFRNIEMRGRDFNLEFDLINDRYVHASPEGATEIQLGCDRNSMFLDAMTDFLDLIAGREPPRSAAVPRLDNTAANCMLIAEAWESREFNGFLTREFA